MSHANTGAIGPSIAYYKSYTSSHYIIQLNCTGTEMTVLECPFSLSNNDACSLNNDANVFCECKLVYIPSACSMILFYLDCSC